MIQRLSFALCVALSGGLVGLAFLYFDLQTTNDDLDRRITDQELALEALQVAASATRTAAVRTSASFTLYGSISFRASSTGLPLGICNPPEGQTLVGRQVVVRDGNGKLLGAGFLEAAIPEEEGIECKFNC
jgi:hypothetical protein